MRKTDEDLEDIARKFLKRLGVEHQVRPDLLTVIVKVKHHDPSFNYERVPDVEMLDAEAQWDSVGRVVRMRESVFVGIQRNEPRARMTVAHELSHCLLGHEGLLNRSVARSANERAVARIQQQESEARRLAAVLLAPEHLVPDPADVDTLMDKFGLSGEAAVIRKAEIDAIRRRRRGEKRPLPKSVVDFLTEAKRRGADVRTEFDE
jgi:Zn-dependent peptidase ImmA (M78 family)